MKTRDWHHDRINELEFHRNKKIREDNINHITFIALLSATIILLLFELQKESPKAWWLISLFGAFTIVMFFVTRDPKSASEEETLIQKNYDAILGREK